MTKPTTPPTGKPAPLASARPEWDYTEHADAYLARPDYPAALIARLAEHVGVGVTSGRIVEVGAGTGNMTLGLGHLGVSAIAVEPNDAMRAWGEKRTSHLKTRWINGTAEATTLPDASADWIMAAQCFDTFEPHSATRELHRVAAPGAYLTVLWNHRVWSDDPLEARIEALIADRLGGYNRGVRRVDPTAALTAAGLFADPVAMEEPHTVLMDRDRYVTVWRSVRTLRVQAGTADRFETLLADIRTLLDDAGVVEIPVQYVTRAWTVRRVDR